MDSSKPPFDDPSFPGTGGDAPDGASTGSSATGAFGAVSGPQTPREDDLLKSLMRQPEGSPPTSDNALRPPTIIGSAHMAEAPVAPVTAPPGEFTQILNTLANLPAAAPSAPAVSSGPKQGGDLAKVFRQVSVDKTPAAPSAAPSAASGSGGSFTQMFSQLSAKPQEHAAAAAETSPVIPVVPPSAVTPPGGFTQMFRTLSAEPTDKGISAPTRPIAPQPASSEPGEFTKTFQAMQAESQPTQVSDERRVQQPTQPTLPITQSSSAPNSFTQMFSTLNDPPAKPQEPMPAFEPQREPTSSFQFNSPARSTEPPAQGGFTQLLQALNREAVPAKEEPPLAPLSQPSAPATPAGGFTQLLRTLSAEPAHQTPLPPIAPELPVAAPAAASGPGEFTRVISGSALRDLQGPGVAAPNPAPVASPAFAPMQMPRAPQVPQVPVVPPIPMTPHAAASAPPAAPHFAPPAFSFPQAAMPPAAVAPAAAEPGKLQKYLPLILVLNVFVLLVIVLILIFALHHK